MARASDDASKHLGPYWAHVAHDFSHKHVFVFEPIYKYAKIENIQTNLNELLLIYTYIYIYDYLEYKVDC